MPVRLFLQRFLLIVSMLFCLASVTYVGFLGIFPYGFSSPRIVCSHPKYDFGDVNVGDDPTHVFTIENAGNEPLLIRNVQSSCSGCVEVLDYSKEPIVPGTKSQIKISLLTERLLGQTAKQVIIFSNDPRQSIMTLEITATVKQPSKEQSTKPDIAVSDIKSSPKVKVSVLQLNENSKNRPSQNISPSISLSNE